MFSSLRAAMLRLPTAALIAFAILPGPAAAYTSLYVFGDSLTDSGNVLTFTQGSAAIPDIPPAPYFQGRFSNGYNFADRLSQRLFGAGVPATAYLQGGNNFAVGGATTGRANVVTAPFGGLVPETGMLAQRDTYLGLHAAADPNALYLVYGGANDMIAMITAAQALPSAQQDQLKDAAIAQAVDNLGDLITGLTTAHASHFLVPNLPDLGKTPRYNGDVDTASFASAASAEFNAALAGVLGNLGTAPGIDIRPLDVHTALNNALDGAYGAFGNTMQACYGGTILGGPPDPCANPDAFVFWDDLHPTARTNQILGDLAYAAAVPEARTWVLLLAGLSLLAASVRRRP